MTDDEAAAVIEKHEGRIISMYEQGLGRVDEPLVVLICEKDGSKRITGHNRATLIGRLTASSKLHKEVTPCQRGQFWCLVIDSKTGRIHSHKMQHFALTAPGTSGLH